MGRKKSIAFGMLLLAAAGCRKPQEKSVALADTHETGQAPSLQAWSRYNRLRCNERYLPAKDREFDTFPEEWLQTGDFDCAVARYLDMNKAVPERAFQHLAEEANRSDKRGAALFHWMAGLDWDAFGKYIASRVRSLRSEEIGELHSKWDYWSKGRTFPSMSDFREQLYERGLHDSDEKVRRSALGFATTHGLTLNEAITLARRLPQEPDSEIGQTILMGQTYFNHPTTNRVVRDYLRGPPEPEVLEWFCDELVDHSRYDFLPDLNAVRRRLESEKDVKKYHEAYDALEAVKKGIAALEDLKRKNVPIAGAAPPPNAAPPPQ